MPHTSMQREPKVRVRWIEKAQALSLVDGLRQTWMKRVVSFALLTGARKGEIFSLKWENVNLSRRIAVVTADNAKSGRARPLPLNDDAVRVINGCDRDSEYVFSVKGERVKQINRTDFAHALTLAGIADFRFHDLRHTWASWHVQSGTPLMTLKALGGWEKLEMVNKYAHLSTEHISKFSGVVTFLAQDSMNEKSSTTLSVVNI